MLDQQHVFLGIAPIGWTNDDMPELDFSKGKRGARNLTREEAREAMAWRAVGGCLGLEVQRTDDH